MQITKKSKFLSSRRLSLAAQCVSRSAGRLQIKSRCRSASIVNGVANASHDFNVTPRSGNSLQSDVNPAKTRHLANQGYHNCRSASNTVNIIPSLNSDPNLTVNIKKKLFSHSSDALNKYVCHESNCTNTSIKKDHRILEKEENSLEEDEIFRRECADVEYMTCLDNDDLNVTLFDERDGREVIKVLLYSRPDVVHKVPDRFLLSRTVLSHDSSQCSPGGLIMPTPLPYTVSKQGFPWNLSSCRIVNEDDASFYNDSDLSYHKRLSSGFGEVRNNMN